MPHVVGTPLTGLSRLLQIAAVAAVVFPGCRSSNGGSLPRERVEELIQPDDVLATVALLAAPEFAGRSPGDAGFEKAALAMAERFEAAGLQPGGGEGYLQHYEMEANHFERAPELSLQIGDGPPSPLEHGVEFTARGFSGSGEVSAPLVFCGYGISRPESGYDDYAGIDVSGKVALVFKQAPPWTLDEEGWGKAHEPRPLAHTAAAHGATAMILVSRPEEEWTLPPYGSVKHGPGEQLESFPQLHVSRERAGQLFADGETMLQLQQAIDKEQKPRSRELNAAAALQVTTEYQPAVDAVNVIGILPGSGKHADEHVILGAHLDHIGTHGDLMFPGANDNASGVAAVLAAAEAFNAGGIRPRRTVVFILFGGEEQGLVGSMAYVADPSLPLDGALAMLNADCVGDGTQLKLGGGGAHPQLRQLAVDLDAAGAKVVHEDTWYGGGADAQPFFDAGIPTLYFANDGGYRNLHQPTDTPATLAPELLAATARLLFQTAAAIADGRYQPEPRQPPAEP